MSLIISLYKQHNNLSRLACGQTRSHQSIITLHTFSPPGYCGTNNRQPITLNIDLNKLAAPQCLVTTCSTEENCVEAQLHNIRSRPSTLKWISGQIRPQHKMFSTKDIACQLLKHDARTTSHTDAANITSCGHSSRIAPHYIALSVLFLCGGFSLFFHNESPVVQTLNLLIF